MPRISRTISARRRWLLKYSPSPRWGRHFCLPKAAVLGCLFACLIILQADHPEWVKFIQGGTPIERAFFRPFNLPAGTVNLRRPPKETRIELSNLISAAPNDAELYALRARKAYN